jgi:hypothetical protein
MPAVRGPVHRRRAARDNADLPYVRDCAVHANLTVLTGAHLLGLPRNKAQHRVHVDQGTPWTHGRCKSCRAARARAARAAARAARPPVIRPEKPQQTRAKAKPELPTGMRKCTSGEVKSTDAFVRILWKGNGGVHRHGTT